MALRYQLQLACRLRDIAPLRSVTSFARLNQAVKQPLLLHARRQHPSVFSCCHYAKGANRPKHSAKDAKPKMTLSDDELAEVVRIQSFRSEVQKVVQRLQDSFVKHLSLNSAAVTGLANLWWGGLVSQLVGGGQTERAVADTVAWLDLLVLAPPNLRSIDTVPVQVDGQEYSLAEVAQIAKKNPQLIVLNMASFPDAIKPTIQAIQASGLNISTQQDGTTVFCHLPKITKEHRESLAKNAKTLFTKAKDDLLSIERKYVKEIQKNKQNASEDLTYNATLQVKMEVENMVNKADAMTKAKQQDLLGEK